LLIKPVGCYEEEYATEAADFAVVQQQAHQVSVVYYQVRHAGKWYRMTGARASPGQTAGQIARHLHVPLPVAGFAAVASMSRQDASCCHTGEW
jgi:hypothetical protein